MKDFKEFIALIEKHNELNENVNDKVDKVYRKVLALDHDWDKMKKEMKQNIDHKDSKTIKAIEDITTAFSKLETLLYKITGSFNK